MKRTIFNCRVDDLTLDKVTDKIEVDLRAGTRGFQISLNTDSVVRANRDAHYANLIKKASVVTIDGMPILWLSKILGNVIRQRVTGPDLFFRLLEIANERRLKVYLLGGREEIVKTVKQKTRLKYPNIKIMGASDGYFGDSEQLVISKIAKTKSDILFVAMGAPRQDEFIADNFDKLDVKFAMGVGGCFDIFAGVKKRAPLMVQKLGLEWFYRFIQEPRRLFGRYFIYDTKIFHLFLKECYRAFFKTGHKRSQAIKKNVAWSIAFQVVGIALSFVMVPLTLKYIGKDEYGTFLTLASFVGWFVLLDLGFGQGLRNKLAESLSNKRTGLAKSYVSTAYVALTAIFGSIYLLFFIVNHYINWPITLGVAPALSTDVRYLAYFIFASFCLQFVLNLLNTVVTADQKPALSSLFSFASSLVTFLAVLILFQTTHGSLLRYGLAVVLSPILVYSAFSIFLFKSKYREIAPSPRFVQTKHIKNLLNVGVQFFVIQLSMIVIFQTDYLVISHLFGPSEVVAYNIVYKYFALITTGFAIVVAPFWSATTEAYAKGDMQWIKNAVSKLKRTYYVFLVAGLVMLVISPWFYNFWLKGAVHVPLRLSIAMFVYAQLLNWGSIYVVFINGVGKVKTQLIISTVGAILNIPLSIFLARNLHLGSAGIIVATTVCIFYGYGIAPIQFRKLIQSKR